MQDNIEKFEAVRDQILDVIDQFPREQRETLIFDKWSLKDIVSHLNHWMEHDLECLDSLKDGTEPFWHPDIDQFNLEGISARKDWTWDKVYNEFVQLSKQLLQTYRTFPVELWDKPIWEGRDLTPLKFLTDDIWHLEAEHLGDMKEKLALAVGSETY
ncbi:MAG: hypothetical protein QY318_03915 [Candidatus Dojkabacteria bacterium]|nr:MAG: hypothetical protein QY318_03915 [Candidatus Dojkabacteria bacterium]